MKIIVAIVTIFLFSFSFATAQVAINTDGSSADASAMLDVKSTDKGILIPRMTDVERDAITSPSEGLVIFNTTTKSLNYFATGQWYRISVVADVPIVLNPATGRYWMDRNLGAIQVATSSTDAAAYGDLFQWGRAAEGHESKTSGNTIILASTPIPNEGNSWDGLFIASEDSPPFDWLSTQNIELWQGSIGLNNPCPTGFRIPTESEWVAEQSSWTSNDADGAFDSPLKLTLGGMRDQYDGYVGFEGTEGYYWSSTVDALNTYSIEIKSDNALTRSFYRGFGFSVRCIKD